MMAAREAIAFLARLDGVLGDASDSDLLAYVADQRRRARDGDDSIFDALGAAHICIEHEIAAQDAQEERLRAAVLKPDGNLCLRCGAVLLPESGEDHDCGPVKPGWE
jgi:hypothetical protein